MKTHRLLRWRLTGSDVCELFRRNLRVVLGGEECLLPEDEPDHPGCADRNEGPLPAETLSKPHGHERHHDADVRAGIEQTGCESAFLLREPHRNSFDRCGKV